ncbi:MAG: (d)CMP kinase [Actinobacteria bacterium]|nr:(d)CMP kinase [Actinomycetota bacterium]MBL7060228.1 (d)CMP kinase [Actinomycetota bacterium]
MNNIITIDGPAGSGKSTIAKILSKELGLKYIDTGAMYRALTLLALGNNLDFQDEASILKIAKKTKIELDYRVTDEKGFTKIKLNGIDVTDEIRSKEVGAAVSIVSKLSGVRRYLVKMQRSIAKGNKVILEGRDTGSIVCPNAILKVFLTANLGERVKRRKLQLEEKKQEIKVKLIRDEMISRDKIDSNRKDSPLIIPENGVVIDTTNMSINEVVEMIRKIYWERLNES